MTIERAIEILDPEHREHYESIEIVNEACRMGMDALNEKLEMVKSMELKPCKCGTMPVKETRRVMAGKLSDGGYHVTLGRYKCPRCDFAPSWIQSYCVCPKDDEWKENTRVWNNFVESISI